MIGGSFGRLTVLGEAEKKGGHRRWLCRCTCGNEKVIHQSALRAGLTRSCGCLRRETIADIGRTVNRRHGFARKSAVTPLWRAWHSMRARCENPTDKSFVHYGRRGIRVCDRWQVFENFAADMGERPSPRHSIDRIDVNGHYEPSNCRWASQVEQNNNKRDNRIVVIGDRKLTIAEVARLAGVPHATMTSRIKRGWTGHQLLEPAKR